MVAVSTSAPLIAGADAPALAIAFWRNALEPARSSRPGCSPDAPSGPGGGLAPRPTAGGHASPGRSSPPTSRRGSRASRSRRWRRRSRSWPPSPCGLPSSLAIAASRSDARHLGGHRARDGRHARSSPGSTCPSPSRALFGDLLALVGGMLAAAYVTVGADVRRHVSTVVYALACYATAAALLLGPVRGHGTGAQRLRPGHVAGHRGAGARRAAARPHAREPRAAEPEPDGGLGGDPVRDPRRHRDRPHRLRRDATGRRRGRPACSSPPEWSPSCGPTKMPPTWSTPEVCSRDPAPLRAGARPARRLVRCRSPSSSSRGRCACWTSIPTTSPPRRLARCWAPSTAPPAGRSTSTATGCPTSSSMASCRSWGCTDGSTTTAGRSPGARCSSSSGTAPRGSAVGAARPPSRRRGSEPAAAPPAACWPSRAWRRRSSR